MKKTKIASLVCALIFVLSPIAMAIMNLVGVKFTDSYRIWLMLLLIPAAFGVLLSVYYLSNRKIYRLPFMLIMAFGIWSVFCALFSETKIMAFFGFVPMSDSVSVYLAYFAMILIGLIIGEDKRNALILAKVFLGVSTIMAFFAILDNDLSYELFVNGTTNCFQYQGIFYNTNHYGYYLVISLIINIYLLQYSDNKIEKCIYLLSFALTTNVLILNNTMGAYIAVLLVLIFAVIWAFIDKEDKKSPVLALGLFIFLSLISTIYTDNVISNFSSMFGDVSTLIEEDSTIEQISGVGSGRGTAWKLALFIIKLSPIIGFGPQGVGFSAHNMFLQIAMCTGIPGLILFLSIIVAGAVRLIKIRKNISPVTRACAFAVVGYLISGFFGLTVFYTAPYFYLVLGVCLAGCQSKTEIEE